MHKGTQAEITALIRDTIQELSLKIGNGKPQENKLEKMSAAAFNFRIPHFNIPVTIS